MLVYDVLCLEGEAVICHFIRVTPGLPRGLLSVCDALWVPDKTDVFPG